MSLTKAFFIFSITIIVSCSGSKEVVYFQESQQNESIQLKSQESIKYKVGDKLNIQVFSEDPEASAPFNRIQTNTADNSGGQPILGSNFYTIDELGNIIFPVVGTIKVEGMNKVSLQQAIVKKLAPYLKDPSVSVSLKNFKITILGEVNNPGTYIVEEDKISIIEAIGLAKDLKIKGKRTDITVVRNVGDEKMFYKLDITSKDIFSSPAYQLVQNDVVYISPNKAGVRAAKDNNFRRVLTTTSSVLSVVLSVLLLTR